MLKLVLKRFVVSKALANRGHFKSKSTLSKDEDVETTTLGSGSDDPLKVVQRHRDFPVAEPQSLLSVLTGSDFYQVAFRSQYRELAMYSRFPSLEFADVVSQCQPNFVLAKELCHRCTMTGGTQPRTDCSSQASLTLFSASSVVAFFSMVGMLMALMK